MESAKPSHLPEGSESGKDRRLTRTDLTHEQPRVYEHTSAKVGFGIVCLQLKPEEI